MIKQLSKLLAAIWCFSCLVTISTGQLRLCQQQPFGYCFTYLYPCCDSAYQCEVYQCEPFGDDGEGFGSGFYSDQGNVNTSK